MVFGNHMGWGFTGGSKMKHTITVPIPHKSLNPNDGAHWRTAQPHKKRARENGYLAALASPLKLAMLDKAEVHVVFYHKENRTRDGDNFQRMLKSTFDGIAHAGVIKDDSGFRHYPIEFKIDKDNPRCEITIGEIIEAGIPTISAEETEETKALNTLIEQRDHLNQKIEDAYEAVREIEMEKQ